jgi:hypothetical protein
MRSIVPWTRLFDDQQLLLAINTDPDQPRTAWVDLHPRHNPEGKRLACLYSSDPAEIGQELEVRAAGERRVASLRVPAGGFCIYE